MEKCRCFFKVRAANSLCKHLTYQMLLRQHILNYMIFLNNSSALDKGALRINHWLWKYSTVQLLIHNNHLFTMHLLWKQT